MPPSREFEPLLREIARMERDIARLKTVESGGGSGGGVVAVVDLTGQTADITETNFDNTSTVGMYRVNVYLLCTTNDGAAGVATVTIRWSDVTGAQSYYAASIDMTTLGYYTGDPWTIAPRSFMVASGSISYEVTHTGSYGSAVYSLHVRVERLPAAGVEDSAPVIVYTTDDTPTTITSITPAAHSVTLVAGYVIARRTGGTAGSEDDQGIGTIVGGIKYDGANISIMNLYGTYGISFASDQAAWDVAWNETPAGTMCLQVTGADDNNITWEWIQSRLLPISVPD